MPVIFGHDNHMTLIRTRSARVCQQFIKLYSKQCVFSRTGITIDDHIQLVGQGNDYHCVSKPFLLHGFQTQKAHLLRGLKCLERYTFGSI